MVTTQQPQTPRNPGNPDPNGPPWHDTQANAYLMNLRAWVDRFNMLGGAHKDNVFALKGAKLGSLEHGVNFGATALRTAFSRNPMQLLQGVFQLGMSVWKIGMERRNLNNFAAKVDGMGGGILNHHELGISMFNNAARAPRWSDGRMVSFEGFDLAMVGLYGKNGKDNVIPAGYTPPLSRAIPEFSRQPELPPSLKH